MCMLDAGVFYEAFRRFLVRRLRFYDDPGVIHVGEASGCLRKAWYNRLMGDRELRHLAPNRHVVLGLGLSIHMVVEEVLRELGYVTERQLIVEAGGVRIAGTPDALSNDHVVEIKTVGRTPDQPYPQHLMQLNAYLALTGVERGYLVYINKRDGGIRVFSHSYNEKLWRRLVDRAKTLRDAIASRTPPPPERGPVCGFCEWQLQCSLEG